MPYSKSHEHGTRWVWTVTAEDRANAHNMHASYPDLRSAVLDRAHRYFTAM